MSKVKRLNESLSLKSEDIKQPSCMTFNIKGKEIMKFTEEGHIFVRGRLTEIDREVVDALRDFLKETGHLK